MVGVTFSNVEHEDVLPYAATVSNTRKLTPHMRRIALTGPGLEGFVSSGRPDERLLVALPPDRSERRSYTVRRWSPQRRELVIDFVTHAGGAAARWAELAKPGDTIGLSEASGWYSPPQDARRLLLVADMTALPALGRILEELPPDAYARVITEVIEPADEQPLISPATVSTRWLHGSGNGLGPSMLGETIRECPDFDYVWFAGEAGVARGVRKWLRHDLLRPASQYHVMGYWRDRKEEWTARYETVRTEIEAAADRAMAEGNGLESVRDVIDAAMERAGL